MPCVVLCWAWFRSNTRRAGRDPFLVRSAYAVDNPKAGCQSAEHVVPADRCAHEIGAFLKVIGGAQQRLNSTVRRPWRVVTIPF